MSTPGQADDHGSVRIFQEAEASRLAIEELARREIARAAPEGKRDAILVVEDSAPLRTVLVLHLQALGFFNVTEACDGREALDMLRQQEFDLLILDIEMPRVNGFQVLEALQADEAHRTMPVLVASADSNLDSVVRCIQLGAEDFLPKPVNPVLLGARITASLERKQLRDLDRRRLIELNREKQLLEIEREKSERLLLNILPASIAPRLKRGEHLIAERYEAVSVLFADLVGFVNLTNRISPEELLSLLNDLFSRFDRIAEVHGMEKIKTIGDCYLVVGGLPIPRANHAESAAEMGLEMLAAVADLNRERGLHLALRIGINSGPVIAGVIGHKKFSYDLWGATVNLAARIQSSGLANRVHLSAHTAVLLGGKFHYTERGTVDCKGLGQVQTCLLERKLTAIEQLIGAGLPPGSGGEIPAS
ncbi:MAG: adenylate/guanylate cyclase domain-containing protein [Verrucomicrobiota bacterium]